MESLVFQRASGARAKVDAEALARMLGFRQLAAHHVEAGGVLLGRHLMACEDVVIDEVTLPMPGDRRSRLRFHRAREQHQQAIDTRWRESQGTCQYLGEWHTHPEPCPTPSRVDLDDWSRRLREDRFEGESLLFLIVGTHAVGAWEGLRRSGEIQPLRPL
jgi:integrative and conjugative element protein (TIGR02256 family)